MSTTLAMSTLAHSIEMANQYGPTNNVFQWLDYTLFFVFLVISSGIGIFFSVTGGRQKTVSEFLLGDRQLAFIPVTLSTSVSYISAITMIGRPSEMYLNGTMFMYADIGALLGFILIPFTFVPLLYPLKITSVFEYLERRFHSYSVRLLGNVLFMLRNVISLGISLYAPCVALERATGGTIKTVYSIIVSGFVATFYTSLGGLKAVVWTDAFQFVVMVAGIVLIIVRSTLDVGGLGLAWQLASNYSRIQFDEISPSLTIRHTVWSVIIGNFFDWFIIGVSPAAVQRYCSLSTQTKARYSVLLSGPASIIITVSSCLAGITVFAFYMKQGCDVYQAGWVGNYDQIIPYYIMDRLSYAGIPGIIVAALFAGSLSNLSSGLAALSATTWEDIIYKFSGRMRDLPASKATYVTKGLVVLYGILTTVMGYLTTSLGGTVLQASISFTGAVGGPFLAMFFLAAFFKHVHYVGVLVGPLVGVAFSLWLSIGSYLLGKQKVSLPSNLANCLFENQTTTLAPTSPIPTTPAPSFRESMMDSFYSISYLWYGTFGILITILTALLITGIIGKPKKPTDPNLLFHFGMCRNNEDDIKNCSFSVDEEDAYNQSNNRLMGGSCYEENGKSNDSKHLDHRCSRL